MPAPGAAVAGICLRADFLDILDRHRRPGVDRWTGWDDVR